MPGKITHNTKIVVSNHVNDVASEVKAMRFSIDGTSWTDWELFEATKDFYLPEVDGIYTVYGQFRDTAGWVSDTLTDSIELQIANTYIDVKPNPIDLLHGHFEFSSDVIGCEFEVSMDGGPWEKLIADSYDFINISEATHTLYVRALTPDGGRDYTPTSYTWQCFPVLGIALFATKPSNPTAELNMSFSLKQNLITAYKWKLDFGPWCDSEVMATAVTPLSYLVSGKHTLYVIAKNIDEVWQEEPTMYEWNVEFTSNSSRKVYIGTLSHKDGMAEVAITGSPTPRVESVAYPSETEFKAIITDLVTTQCTATFKLKDVFNQYSPSITKLFRKDVSKVLLEVNSVPAVTRLVGVQLYGTAGSAAHPSNGGGIVVKVSNGQADTVNYGTITNGIFSWSCLLFDLVGKSQFDIFAITSNPLNFSGFTDYIWVHTEVPVVTIINLPPIISTSVYSLIGTKPKGAIVSVQLNEGSFEQVSSLSHEYTWSKTLNLVDGWNQIEVSIVDQAGNIGNNILRNVYRSKTEPLLLFDTIPRYAQASTLTLSGKAESGSYLQFLVNGVPRPFVKVPISKIWSLNVTGLDDGENYVSVSVYKSGNIIYTTDGSDPTIGGFSYTSPIVLDHTATIRAIAIDQAGNISQVVSQDYTIDKIPPAIVSIPPAGNYTKPFFVKLQSLEAKTLTCEYNKPATSDSDPYDQPIFIFKTSYLQAIAEDEAGNSSYAIEFGYQFPSTIMVEVFPPENIYTGDLLVSFITNIEGMYVHYTLNGTDPTTQSARYTHPIILKAAYNQRNVTIKFVGNDGLGNLTQVYSRSYVLMPQTFQIPDSVSTWTFHSMPIGSTKSDFSYLYNGVAPWGDWRSYSYGFSLTPHFYRYVYYTNTFGVPFYAWGHDIKCPSHLFGEPIPEPWDELPGVTPQSPTDREYAGYNLPKTFLLIEPLKVLPEVADHYRNMYPFSCSWLSPVYNLEGTGCIVEWQQKFWREDVEGVLFSDVTYEVALRIGYNDWKVIYEVPLTALPVGNVEAEKIMVNVTGLLSEGFTGDDAQIRLRASAPWDFHRSWWSLEHIKIAGVPDLRILSTTPYDKSEIDSHTTIDIYFSEEVLASTINSRNFILGDGIDAVPCSFTYDPAEFKVSMHPAEYLKPDSYYGVAIRRTVCAALYGQPMIDDHTFVFRTFTYDQEKPESSSVQLKVVTDLTKTDNWGYVTPFVRDPYVEVEVLASDNVKVAQVRIANYPSNTDRANIEWTDWKDYNA